MELLAERNTGLELRQKDGNKNLGAANWVIPGVGNPRIAQESIAGATTGFSAVPPTGG